MISCWFFVGSYFVLIFCVVLVTGFFLLLFYLCLFLENQIVWFGFVFRLFCVLCFLFLTYQ